jgi:hypothetical protein
MIDLGSNAASRNEVHVFKKKGGQMAALHLHHIIVRQQPETQCPPVFISPLAASVSTTTSTIAITRYAVSFFRKNVGMIAR